MGPAIIAVIILALISFVSIKFRGFACFNLVMIGLAMAIAGDIFRWPGIIMLAGGILILYLTSLKAAPRMRMHYMFNMFLSGLFSFLKLFMICTIILIPIGTILGGIGRNYREVAIADLATGNIVGRTYVDMDSGQDLEGNTYSRIDKDPY